MSVPVHSVRPLAPVRPTGPVAPAPAPTPVQGPVTSPDSAAPEVFAELGLGSVPTPGRAADRLRDWRAFDLVDGRRRQARADLALARRALDERTAHHAPTRAAARALLDALAAERLLELPPARGKGAAEGAFWLEEGVETLRRLAEGATDAGPEDGVPVDADDAPRAPLFVALGALRARLGRGATLQDGQPASSPELLEAAGAPASQDDAPGRLAHAAGRCAVRALAAQRPHALDPAAIPLLDAHARGCFDSVASDAIESLVDAWAATLADVPALADREVRRWSTALAGLAPRVPEELFPALRVAAGESWPAVATALRAAALPGAVEGWCTELDAGRPFGLRTPREPAGDEAAAIAAVDVALDALIAAPDAEEAALAARVRDARGRLRAPADDAAPAPDAADAADAADAPAATDAPATPDEPSPAPTSGDRAAPHRESPAPPSSTELSPAPFGQWLATIAMAPARVGASPALRRWAALRARASILGAFDFLAEEARANPARDVAVALEGWRGRLGDPDGALVQSLDVAMRRRGAASELAADAPRGGGLLLAAGLLLVTLGALARVWTIGLAGVAIAAAWRVTRSAHAHQRARLRAAAGMAHARAVAALRAVVDEWAAVRRDLAEGVARMPAARERLRRALSR